MALGTVTVLNQDASAIEVLASAIATNGAPTGTAGITAESVRALTGGMPQSFRVGVYSTAGSGTMTVAVRLWTRLGALGWVVAQPIAALSTAIQTAGTIAETGTDTIGWTEVVNTIAGADRYYLEIVSIAGTATAVTGVLIVSRPNS